MKNPSGRIHSHAAHQRNRTIRIARRNTVCRLSEKPRPRQVTFEGLSRAEPPPEMISLRGWLQPLAPPSTTCFLPKNRLRLSASFWIGQGNFSKHCWSRLIRRPCSCYAHCWSDWLSHRLDGGDGELHRQKERQVVYIRFLGEWLERAFSSRSLLLAVRLFQHQLFPQIVCGEIERLKRLPPQSDRNFSHQWSWGHGQDKCQKQTQT